MIWHSHRSTDKTGSIIGKLCIWERKRVFYTPTVLTCRWT